MFFYYAILLFFLSASLVRGWNARQKKRMFLSITFILIFILIGFRDTSVGTDTISYETYFDLYKKYGLIDLIFGKHWFKRLEPCFISLLKLATYISSEYYVVLILEGFLYALLFTSLLYRLDDAERYNFALLFYAFYHVCDTMNITRQSIAALFLAHGVIYFRLRKNLKLLLCVVIGSLFHYSASIPAMLLILLCSIRNNAINAIILKVLIFMTITVGALLYQVIFRLVNIGGYISSQNASRGAFNLISMICIYAFWMLKKDTVKDKILRVLYDTSIIISIVFCYLGGITAAFIRFSRLFMLISLFPCIQFDNRHLSSLVFRVMQIGLYIIAIIYFVHSITANINFVVPYSFFFD